MKRVAMTLVRFYRKYLSGLKPAPTCRFTPTCSAYSLEAFEKRGFFAGFALTIWRILRCSPLSPAGYDPVPKQGFKTMPMPSELIRETTVSTYVVVFAASPPAVRLRTTLCPLVLIFAISLTYL